MIWILLWILLSVMVLGIFAWTTKILFEQKRAWAVFAKKYNLTYQRGRMFDSPYMYGMIDGARLNFFTEGQKTSDTRGVRFKTVIEIILEKSMPFPCVFGSAAVADLIANVNYPYRHVPAGPDWDPAFFAFGRNEDFLKSYLTPARQKTLGTLFRAPGAGVIFIFDEKETLLRTESADAFNDPKRLDAHMRKMFEAVRALEFTEAEAAAWKAGGL